ncbi:hypothetical protein EP56_01730 [Listeriaceae bacterium FSL A5-0209]|nr:hypothetical protein EP56_01730 [Listeriaceae bacterium FSL A5-0209]
MLKTETCGKNKWLVGLFFLGMVLVLTAFLLPHTAFAASQLESSLNTTAETGYNTLKNVSFWVGVFVIALGFFLCFFKGLDKSGTGVKIIIGAVFGIGGIAASPAIAQWIQNMFGSF